MVKYSGMRKRCSMTFKESNCIRPKYEEAGFTLAELLIVVAIIATLVAISIPVFTSQLEKSREATDLSNIRAAADEAVTDFLGAGAKEMKMAMVTSVKQKNMGWLIEEGYPTLTTRVNGTEMDVPIPNIEDGDEVVVIVNANGVLTVDAGNGDSFFNYSYIQNAGNLAPTLYETYTIGGHNIFFSEVNTITRIINSPDAGVVYDRGKPGIVSSVYAYNNPREIGGFIGVEGVYQNKYYNINGSFYIDIDDTWYKWDTSAQDWVSIPKS